MHMQTHRHGLGCEKCQLLSKPHTSGKRYTQYIREMGEHLEGRNNINAGEGFRPKSAEETHSNNAAGISPVFISATTDCIQSNSPRYKFTKK